MARPNADRELEQAQESLKPRVEEKGKKGGKVGKIARIVLLVLFISFLIYFFVKQLTTP